MTDLHRRCLAEFLGTAGLVAIVIGSGIAAERYTDDVGLQLLENTVATGAGLVALILAFGSVSGAHFNPVVTLIDRLFGGRTTREAAAYMTAQVAGACAGAIVANLMFELDAIDWSQHQRATGALWLGEVVATFGLLVVIFGVVRSGRSGLVPFAVGGYITAAYWFTSSTSFANPAVTIGRSMSDTFAGISPSSVPLFVVFQVAGALIALVCIRVLYPDVAAEDVVMPEEKAA